VRKHDRLELEARDHGWSALRIPVNVAASGLYLARLSWSFWSAGSDMSYGRYSTTSLAQREAFGTPAAVRAAAMSDSEAVFADTFATAGAEAVAAAEAAEPDGVAAGVVTAEVAVGAAVAGVVDAPPPLALEHAAARAATDSAMAKEERR
jgi:hypothetical protein